MTVELAVELMDCNLLFSGAVAYDDLSGSGKLKWTLPAFQEKKKYSTWYLVLAS